METATKSPPQASERAAHLRAVPPSMGPSPDQDNGHRRADALPGGPVSASPLTSTDPFLPAWGRTVAWRADALAGQMLAHVPRALVEHDPAQALTLARALANTVGLRHYLVEQIDGLLDNLRSPHLHRAMRNMRAAGQGWIPAWRRHNAKSAIGLCYLVEQEALFLARAKLQAQDQQAAIEMAQGQLEQVLDNTRKMDFLPADQHDRLVATLERDMEGLGMLHDHLARLLSGIEALCRKARIYDEMCNAVPNHEDILNSRVFRGLMATLLAQPRSGLAVCKE